MTEKAKIEAYLKTLAPFAEKVLRAVIQIPLGECRTYQEIAEKIGQPLACRAVGTVLRKNQLPVLIPCHRVIKSNGDLGNYSNGGTQKKRQLLEQEKEAAAAFAKQHDPDY